MIGIDIISIGRMRSFIARFEELALERFLSSEEIALCFKSNGQKATKKTAFVDTINVERVAGFWAAKEALSKALGVGIGAELGFLDIQIYKNHKNQPHIALTNEKMRLFDIKHIALSISHDRQQIKDTKTIVVSEGFAVAVVICT